MLKEADITPVHKRRDKNPRRYERTTFLLLCSKILKRHFYSSSHAVERPLPSWLVNMTSPKATPTIQHEPFRSAPQGLDPEAVQADAIYTDHSTHRLFQSKQCLATSQIKTKYSTSLGSSIPGSSLTLTFTARDLMASLLSWLQSSLVCHRETSKARFSSSTSAYHSPHGQTTVISEAFSSTIKCRFALYDPMFKHNLFQMRLEIINPFVSFAQGVPDKITRSPSKQCHSLDSRLFCVAYFVAVTRHDVMRATTSNRFFTEIMFSAM